MYKHSRKFIYSIIVCIVIDMNIRSYHSNSNETNKETFLFRTFLWTSAPFLVALCSFATYVLSDPNNVLDANTAFVSLTLFNLLRIPLNFLPSLLVYLVQCGVSVKRVNTFMNADELDANAIKHNKVKNHDTK